MTEADILIVGAGPAGLTLANDLAMRDAPFRIIDSAPEPPRESRAHGFANRTLLALDKLELAGRLCQRNLHEPLTGAP